MRKLVHIYHDTSNYVDILRRHHGTYLLKPNLFTTISSEKGATTDPILILSVAEALKRSGSKPIVGEYPAMASYACPDTVFDGLDIRNLRKKHDIELRVLSAGCADADEFA